MFVDRIAIGDCIKITNEDQVCYAIVTDTLVSKMLIIDVNEEQSVLNATTFSDKVQLVQRNAHFLQRKWQIAQIELPIVTEFLDEWISTPFQTKISPHILGTVVITNPYYQANFN